MCRTPPKMHTGPLASDRDKLDGLIGCLNDGLIFIDEEAKIDFVNDEAARVLGASRDALLGRDLLALVGGSAPPGPDDEMLAALRDAVARGKPWRDDDASFAIAAGKSVPVALRFNPVVTLGRVVGGAMTLRDISRQKHLEGSLTRAQKLEALGRLAVGIAHEINTPIQFVSDNTHFLKSSFESVRSLLRKQDAVHASVDDDLREELERLAEETDIAYFEQEIPVAIAQSLDGLQRVGAIVQAMKGFTHTENGGEQRRADINAALASTLTVARHELRTVAETIQDFDEIPPIFCHLGDLNQVFLNLFVNAAHAIGEVMEKTGRLGRVTVRTRREEGCVVISVADTGGGIPDAVAARLFEPFFTTKPVGRGTGQGLALARTIVVEKHGGSLTFDTVVGEGTTFHVRLPVGGVPLVSTRAA